MQVFSQFVGAIFSRRAIRRYDAGERSTGGWDNRLLRLHAGRMRFSRLGPETLKGLNVLSAKSDIAVGSERRWVDEPPSTGETRVYRQS